MPDTHHTYESIHQEHHAWRKYLLEERNKLSELEGVIEKQSSITEKPEEKIICNELDARRKLLLMEVDNKLKNLTDTDTLMSHTNDKHNVVSHELFLINSRMRAGLLEFDQGCERLRRDMKTLG